MGRGDNSLKKEERKRKKEKGVLRQERVLETPNYVSACVGNNSSPASSLADVSRRYQVMGRLSQ